MAFNAIQHCSCAVVRREIQQDTGLCNCVEARLPRTYLGKLKNRTYLSTSSFSSWASAVYFYWTYTFTFTFTYIVIWGLLSLTTLKCCCTPDFFMILEHNKRCINVTGYSHTFPECSVLWLGVLTFPLHLSFWWNVLKIMNIENFEQSVILVFIL